MGLSSSKTTTGPSKQALPYLTSASSAVQNAVSGNQNNLNNISSSLSGAYGDYASSLGSGLTAAQSYNDDVLGGKYLTQSNPYLQGIIDDTNSSVADKVNALFSQSGQTGSSRQIGELGKQLSSAENNLRYQNYSDEMARMDSAANTAATLNSANNSNYSTLAALGQTAAELPLTNATTLADALGGLWGNSTTTKQSGSVLGSLLSAGTQLGSAAILASDRRLKENIVKVGELPDGLGVYEYNYLWEGGDQVRRGVMADEVAQLRPWALGPKIAGGYSTVDYGAL